ncbi:DedA family protein [Niveispirillum irakense]|uniref:DedA family protein n=1 Tax=Niveispirillum irakense TaxID=34011 RepID=UPI0004068C58|nr:DedA family protein [Niveispirillum irakense]
MIGHILDILASGIVAVISAMGYAGVSLLMAIESACIPLPSEIIMPFAGYLVSTAELNLILVATAGAIGCNLGSEVAYVIGKRGGRTAILRWGRYVLLDAHDLDMADRFFARFGAPAMFIARLLPVIRTFIALPAGISAMPRVPFHLYTFVGSWIWCYGLAYVGMKLGTEWHENPVLRTWLHRFDFVIVLTLLVLGGLFVWHKMRGLRRSA